MMTIGEPHRWTVEIPPWHFEDSSAHVQSPITHNIYAEACQYGSAMSALLRYLPSNKDDGLEGADEYSDDFEVPVDAFSCDDFRMFEFKVRKCVRARNHDWMECPFAHPGEKARRRDPRKYHYYGTPCPEFRKGACKRGDACEYAHGVFECWLHPARYRTQPCKDGTRCRRRVCFFAHTSEQLRIFPHATTSPDASPSVLTGDSFVALGLSGSSPKSSSYSPPVSPKTLSPPLARVGLKSINSVDQLAESIGRRLQVNNVKMGMGLCMSPSYRGEIGSPRSPNMIRTVFTSLPPTPIRSRGLKHARLGTFDLWETSCQEEPLIEYPEYRVGLVDIPDTDPDIGWVSELIE
ncbi:zinc finger CCCH domain-containing protein 20-like [Primulina huaijiensis]|uniref:zinc finger CCCH domain-containing protein 20-like n=1 Tax=Primulina huaijiensis TaxID=1492673 RepID=UPI003CC6EC54